MTLVTKLPSPTPLPILARAVAVHGLWKKSLCSLPLSELQQQTRSQLSEF